MVMVSSAKNFKLFLSVFIPTLALKVVALYCCKTNTVYSNIMKHHLLTGFQSIHMINDDNIIMVNPNFTFSIDEYFEIPFSEGFINIRKFVYSTLRN